MQIEGVSMISIPNDVLIVPEEYVDSSGVVRTNSSKAVLLLGPLDGVNTHDIPKVGLEFFSGAYLTVNLDNQTWSIWPVNPTTDKRLVAIGSGDCKHDEPVPTIVPPVSNNTSEGLSVGAIAGIAAGAYVLVVLIGVIACFMRKKREVRVRANPPPFNSPSAPYSAHDQKWQDEMQYMQEMDINRFGPTELSARRTLAELPQDHQRYKPRGTSFAAAELPSTPF